MSSRSYLWQRVGVAVLGLTVATVMIVLGLWQMQVFEDQGDKDARLRSTAAPVDLLPLIPADGSVGDVYGRNVRVQGTYRPDETVSIVDKDGSTRVLTALVLPDGRALPVVRGMTNGPQHQPPTGTQDVTGVFLPSDAADDLRTAPPGAYTSVRIPLLQQQWSEQLAPGYVTLNAPEAAAQGLQPGEITLPKNDGKFRNFGYALQWWVFAAFAVIMCVIWDRALRHRARARESADDAVSVPEQRNGSLR